MRVTEWAWANECLWLWFYPVEAGEGMSTRKGCTLERRCRVGCPGNLQQTSFYPGLWAQVGP